MADSRHMTVPTLAVDLAWHTHQLSPYDYFTLYTTRHYNHLVDHSTTRSRTGTLDDSFHVD